LEYYAEKDDKHIDEETIAHVMKCILLGLVDIHRMNIIHSDIKA